MKIPPRRGVTLLEVAVVLAIFTVMGGAVMLGLQQTGRRTLYQASLQLQADMRYVQRRAAVAGRAYGILFELAHNQYRIVYFMGTPSLTAGTRYVRTVALPAGVHLEFVTQQRLWYHPRGTPSSGFRVILRQGNHVQHTTVSVSGGRAYIWPINYLTEEY